MPQGSSAVRPTNGLYHTFYWQVKTNQRWLANIKVDIWNQVYKIVDNERGTGLSNDAVCISGAPSSGSANRHFAWTRAAREYEEMYVKGFRLLIFPQTKRKLRLSRHQNDGCICYIKVAN